MRRQSRTIATISSRPCIGLTLILLFAAPLLVSELSAAQTPPRNQVRLSVESEPLTLLPGAPFLVRVASSRPIDSLKGSWLGHDVFFEFDRPSGRWVGLAGVGLDVAPGSHLLLLIAEDAAGVRTQSRHPLTVGKVAYRSSALSVARKFTEPDAATAARIAEEQALKKDIFSRQTLVRQWEGSFQAPVANVTTETFGTQRTFNGVVQSVHQGLDYRAAPGTPVRAMNSGTVILARELFFEGNCVVIDHGQGLLSLYLHLSELSVKEGERLQKTQEIGLSGGTGRVTGPHLHVALRWQGLYLDPARMLRLDLPKSS